MKSIRVNNLRSLVDVGEIDIAPITVLVGQNSCGKSTLLRTFPLLKQTFEQNTSEPLLWYGDYVDFGSFNESLANYKNIEEKPKEIEFIFHFRLGTHEKTSFIPHSLRKYLYTQDEQEINLELKISMGPTNVTQCLISFQDQIVNINYKKTPNFKINMDDNVFKFELDSDRNQFIPYINGSGLADGALGSFFSVYDIPDYRPAINELKNLIGKELKNQFCDTEVIDDFIEGISGLYSRKRIFTLIKEYETESDSFQTLLKQMSEESILFSNINNLVLASQINNLIFFCNYCVQVQSSHIVYSKPLRTSAERYYRMQGLNVSTIEPSGLNVPMFLANLSKDEKREFGKFTERLFGFNFVAKGRSEYVSINIKKNGKLSNLADEGVGYSQMLPLIVNLWNTSRYPASIKSLFAIEQPELHLHPALQGKLVEAFSDKDVLKSMNILFETHSDKMVNHLGYLISENKLTPSDVNIYMFTKTSTGKTKIEKKDFNCNGQLNDWPVDFFFSEV